MNVARFLVAVWAAALLSACGSSPASSPSAAEPSASARAQAGLPPGCAPIDLRSPTGERIDLTGEWAGSGVLAWERETVWLNQLGDCVYGSVVGGDPLGERGLEGTLTNVSGRIGSDFRVRFEIVIVHQPPVFALGVYSTMDMSIEWDADGRMRIREDRELGETAGRCIQLRFDCPDPVIWYSVEDAPPS